MKKRFVHINGEEWGYKITFADVVIIPPGGGNRKVPKEEISGDTYEDEYGLLKSPIRPSDVKNYILTKWSEK